MLNDTFGRSHDYLRIALTDHCNFRCTYCMPDENVSFMNSSRLMRPEEILGLAGLFVRLGVRRIRLTGGEPLIRKEAPEIMAGLATLPVELTLTTNGFSVDNFISHFENAGIRSLNISLDTLDKKKFFRITRREMWQKVWSNILLLLDHGFHVKVNCVVMKDVNENEITDFIELTRDLPLHVRFIEFMPFTGNLWAKEKLFSYSQMLELIERRFSFEKLKDHYNDTAKKFKVPGFRGTFAVISTMSTPFCSGCNRMRLTADGKMKNCLFSKGEADLLSAWRKNEDVETLIRSCLKMKEKELGGQFSTDLETSESRDIINRSMIAIGG